MLEALKAKGTSTDLLTQNEEKMFVLYNFIIENLNCKGKSTHKWLIACGFFFFYTTEIYSFLTVLKPGKYKSDGQPGLLSRRRPSLCFKMVSWCCVLCRGQMPCTHMVMEGESLLPQAAVQRPWFYPWEPCPCDIIAS